MLSDLVFKSFPFLELVDYIIFYLSIFILILTVTINSNKAITEAKTQYIFPQVVYLLSDSLFPFNMSLSTSSVIDSLYLSRINRYKKHLCEPFIDYLFWKGFFNESFLVLCKTYFTHAGSSATFLFSKCRTNSVNVRKLTSART